LAGFAAQRHVRVLGVLFLACGSIRLLLVVLALSIWADRAPPGVRRWATIRSLLLPVVAATGMLGLIAGAGLLTRRPWARQLALLPAALNLPVVPFGTAQGVYAFVALRGKDVAALFHSSG
jgi:hypothetical protein